MHMARVKKFRSAQAALGPTGTTPGEAERRADTAADAAAGLVAAFAGRTGGRSVRQPAAPGFVRLHWQRREAPPLQRRP
jgi:hypothetical protein